MVITIPSRCPEDEASRQSSGVIEKMVRMRIRVKADDLVRRQMLQHKILFLINSVNMCGSKFLQPTTCRLAACVHPRFNRCPWKGPRPSRRDATRGASAPLCRLPPRPSASHPTSVPEAASSAAPLWASPPSLPSSSFVTPTPNAQRHPPHVRVRSRSRSRKRERGAPLRWRTPHAGPPVHRQRRARRPDHPLSRRLGLAKELGAEHAHAARRPKGHPQRLDGAQPTSPPLPATDRGTRRGTRAAPGTGRRPMVDSQYSF